MGGRVRSLDKLRAQVSPTGRIAVDPGAGSSILPSDIPAPRDARIMESFDVASSNGNVQGTRTYVSDRSIAEEAKLYRAYLKDNGWEVKDDKENANYVAILATRETKQMLVSITGHDGSTRVTISAFAAPATY
jgi:hypothetical protein